MNAAAHDRHSDVANALVCREPVVSWKQSPDNELNQAYGPVIRGEILRMASSKDSHVQQRTIPSPGSIVSALRGSRKPLRDGA